MDSLAVRFLLANIQHLLVDVTDHSPGFHWPVRLLSRAFRINVRPGGASRPLPLLLLLKTNVLQETEGNVTCGGGGPTSFKVFNPATCEKRFTCSTGHVQELCPWLGIHDMKKRVFPQAMNPEAHGIVHDVILLRHILKHLIH